MLDPNTPPGTRVRCVAEFWLSVNGVIAVSMRVGEKGILKQIIPTVDYSGGGDGVPFGAQLTKFDHDHLNIHQIKWAMNLSTLVVDDLPEELTSILQEVEMETPVEVETVE